MNRMQNNVILLSLTLAVAFLALAASLIAQPASQPADSVRRLKVQRLDAAMRTYELLVDAPVKAGGRAADPEATFRWSLRWMEAEREATSVPEARKTAREAHVKRMQELEKRVKQKFQSGEAMEADVAAAEFYRLDAENWPTTFR